MLSPEAVYHIIIEKIMEYLIVFVLASFVSYIELLSRYNKPHIILQRSSSIIYIVVNGVAGILGYYLILRYNILETNDRVLIIAASISSSLFIMRSSLSKIKTKSGDTFDIGLAPIIDVLLRWSEREFDRISANGDLKSIHDIMNGLEFEEIFSDLPEVCLDKMESVDANVSSQLAKEVAMIRNKTTQIQATKSILLGNKIASIAGIDLLETGVEILRKELKKEASAYGKGDQITKEDLEQKSTSIEEFLKKTESPKEPKEPEPPEEASEPPEK